MKKLSAFLAVVGMCGAAMAADLTPASKEAGVKVQTAQAVTNAQAVAIGAGLNVLTGVGSAAGSTNTITLAAPSSAGIDAIVCIGAGSNVVRIADSGTAELAAAFAGDTNDVIHLIAVSTSKWVAVSASDN